MQGTILETIVASVREELPRRKKVRPLDSLIHGCEDPKLPKTRGFRKALQRRGIHVIAEIKQASPSKGRFHRHRSLFQQGREYEQGGASCISVVTEPRFFSGSLGLLSDLKPHVTVPLLRKDFVVDSYQAYEARLAGADALLLIVSILKDRELNALMNVVEELQMDALVEVCDRGELERALGLGAQLIGVNNRDLRDFSTDVSRSLDLAALIPPSVTTVSESGIQSNHQITRLKVAGFDGFLVGEYLMRQKNPGQALRELCAANTLPVGST